MFVIFVNSGRHGEKELEFFQASIFSSLNCATARSVPARCVRMFLCLAKMLQEFFLQSVPSHIR